MRSSTRAGLSSLPSFRQTSFKSCSLVAALGECIRGGQASERGPRHPRPRALDLRSGDHNLATRPRCLALLSAVRLALGDVGAARAHAEEALHIARRYEAKMHEWMAAVALARARLESEGTAARDSIERLLAETSAAAASAARRPGNRWSVSSAPKSRGGSATKKTASASSARRIASFLRDRRSDPRRAGREGARRMKCPACSFENAAGMEFCGECGGALALKCRSCGFENLPSVKFCGECGQPLAVKSLPVASPNPRSYTPAHLVDRRSEATAALRLLEAPRRRVGAEAQRAPL